MRGFWENGGHGKTEIRAWIRTWGKWEFGLGIQRRGIGTIAGKMGIWDFEISFAFAPVLAFELTGQVTFTFKTRLHYVDIHT